MPYKNNATRMAAYDYKAYDGTAPVKKKRAERNAARATLAKEGLVHKGDGLDVDHKKPLRKGGSNDRSNLRAIPVNKNRSFKR